MTDYCDLTDLEPSMCGCQRHRGKNLPKPVPSWEADGRVVPATFDSDCPACLRPIHEGDDICHTTEGSFVHEHCAIIPPRRRSYF